MKNNPNQFKVGDTAVLDKDYLNHCEVKIIHITTNGLFCRIKSDNTEWDVMTNRLSPKNIKQCK